MKDEDEKRKLSEKLKSFKYFLEYENWLTVLPTSVTFPITEKAQKKRKRLEKVLATIETLK